MPFSFEIEGCTVSLNLLISQNAVCVCVYVSQSCESAHVHIDVYFCGYTYT